MQRRTSNSLIALRVSDRKDRRGAIIRKGSKEHHITFKDRIVVRERVRNNEDSEKIDSGVTEQPSRKSKRLNLTEVVVVENYKKLNRERADWEKSCCTIF